MSSAAFPTVTFNGHWDETLPSLNVGEVKNAVTDENVRVVLIGTNIGTAVFMCRDTMTDIWTNLRPFSLVSLEDSSLMDGGTFMSEAQFERFVRAHTVALKPKTLMLPGVLSFE